MSVETVGVDELRAHVRVTGDLDISTGAPLWAVLEGHLAAGRRFLRLDLSGVTFVDAAGLTGIARLHQAALDQRGALLLVGVHARIARLLRLTGLDEVLFIDGARDAPPPVEPVDEPGTATVWPARPVPWTPLGVARTSVPAPPDQPSGSRSTRG